MSLISIGSDMEVFAKNKTGKHIALCGKIGGTKEEPLQLEHLRTGFMVQEDNVALEFNIPVCTSRTAFLSAFKTMRKETTSILKNLNLTLSKNASVSFDKTELTHPKALIFGCEPDYDAWKLTENKKPTSTNECLRTAGGHIHVGTQVHMIDGIRAMDLFLGVPSVLIDDSPASQARRELYGKAGAMRPKPYGFEYRVLSNFWFFKDELVNWVYNQTSGAMNLAHIINEEPNLADKIQACINTGNKELAQDLVSTYNITMPSSFQQIPEELPF